MPEKPHTYWHGFSDVRDAVAARRARIAAKEKAEREAEREEQRLREESFAASERARRGRT